MGLVTISPGAAAVGVLTIFGALWYAKRQALGLAPSLNPVNPDNIFYGAVNETGAAITGNNNFSLGAWIWEATHPEIVAYEKELLK